MAIDKIDSSAIDDSQITLGFRNKIIGGNFSTNPWQRGFTFNSAASGIYSADRWQNFDTTTTTMNIGRAIDAPTVAQSGVFSQHCLHLDVDVADTALTASQYYMIGQKPEGYNVMDFGFGQSGTRYVTLSFWHKHTKTGIYCVALQNGAENRSYVAEYTQSSSDAWEKAEITIPVDTSGTWLYDSGVGIRLYFSVAIGSDFYASANSWSAGNYLCTSNQVNALDSTDNNFKIALAQLEAGQTATAFENRSVGQELALCQRYYQVGEFLQYAASSSYTYWYYSQIDFITQMRANPTMTNTSGGSPYQTASGNSGVNFTSQSPRRTVTYPSNSAGWHAVSFNYSASAEL